MIKGQEATRRSTSRRATSNIPSAMKGTRPHDPNRVNQRRVIIANQVKQYAIEPADYSPNFFQSASEHRMAERSLEDACFSPKGETKLTIAKANGLLEQMKSDNIRMGKWEPRKLVVDESTNVVGVKFWNGGIKKWKFIAASCLVAGAAVVAHKFGIGLGVSTKRKTIKKITRRRRRYLN